MSELYLIDTVILGGQTRRHYHFEGPMEWIEGIGDIKRGLFHSIHYPILDQGYLFDCYRYAGQHVLGNCMSLAIDEISEKESGWTISPNPLTSRSEILFQEAINQLPETVNIIDITGRIVRSITPSTRRIELNRQNFETGVYLIHSPSSSNLDALKFIVQ